MFGSPASSVSIGGQPSGDTPLLFYSRRIGLNQGREVPILGGGRLTGRVGRFSIGVLNIADAGRAGGARAPATNFSRAARQARHPAPQQRRRDGDDAVGDAERDRIEPDAYGVDGTFAFFANLVVQRVLGARRRTDRPRRRATRATARRWTTPAIATACSSIGSSVGDNFNPEVGFVRRDNIGESIGQVRFSPRPASITSVRKFSGHRAPFTHIEDGSGLLRDARRPTASSRSSSRTAIASASASPTTTSG